MSSVDQRVVEMQFKNQAFARGIADAIGSLQKLQEGLKLNGASKGFAEAGAGVDQLNQKTGFLGGQFTALQAIAFGALASIGAKAVQVGSMVGSALTIDPITSGLSEYETNLNSVQTILANTKVSGAGIAEVNAALDELNNYSDLTIYNFSEMARNIGTFTAAGVGLDRSVSSIKGIANLAALSGSNSAQAANAMYQLSQEIAAGRVSLMGWNSVVNAGMGGSTFQRALAQTAVAFGKLDESSLKLEGDMQNVVIAGESFRDSIGGGDSWLTSDILTATLSQFTGDMTRAELAAQGFTEAQIDSIITTAETARAAATEVKTLTGVFDTAKEVAGSGWAKTWQLIFGDFMEAKTTFTELSLWVNGFLERSASRRNELLAEWKIMGGRDMMLAGMREAGYALLGVLRPIGEAFRSIFPATTAQELYDATKAFRAFMMDIKPGPETIENLRRTFAGFFAVLGIGWELVKAGAGFFGRLFGTIFEGSGSILKFTGNIGDFLVALHDAIAQGDVFGRFFDGLADFIEAPIVAIKALIGWIGSLFGAADDDGGLNAVRGLNNAMDGLGDTAERIGDAWNALGDWLERLWQRAQPGIDAIRESVENIASWIGERLSTISFADILAGVATGAFAAALVSLRGFIEDIREVFSGDDDGPGFLSGLNEALQELTEVLQAMQNALNASALLAIAAAIGIMAASVVAVSKINADDLAKAIVGIAGLSAMLVVVAKILGNAEAPDMASIIAMSAGLLLFSTAVRILASAVVELSTVDWNGLAKGLTGTLALLAMVVATAKLMPANDARMVATGTGIILLAAAIRILVESVQEVQNLKWENVGKGLTVVATLLGALGLFTRFARVNNAGIRSGAGIILLSVAIRLLVEAMEEVSDLKWEYVGKGLAVVAVGLGLFAGALQLMPQKSLLNAAAILVVAASLSLVSDAMHDISKLDWNSIAEGITTIAVALGAVALALKFIPTGSIFSGGAILLVSAGLHIIAGAMEKLGRLDWEEIGKAMVGIAGSLTILTLALNFLRASISGAAALVIAAYAIEVLSGAMQSLGGMSWADIGAALVTLGGSLLILGAALYFLSGTALGAAALVLAAGAIAILTPALVALGAMSWSDIGAAIGSLTLLFVVLAIGGALSPLILLLATALTVLAAAIAIAGAGIYLAGEGIESFALAMQALAEVDAEGIKNIITVLTEVFALIPTLFAELGEGVVEFARGLTAAAPEFGAAASAWLQEMVRVLENDAPAAINALLQIVVVGLEGLAAAVPDMATAGMQLIIGVLNGIGTQIGPMGDAATRLIVAFMQAIARNAPKVIDQAIRMIITVINGMAAAVETHSEELGQAGRNLASAIIDGMYNGLLGGSNRITAVSKTVARNALGAAKKELGVNSPSRAFMELGRWSAIGLADGLEKYAYLAEDSAGSVGQSAIDGMSKTISGLGDLINSEVGDLNPTITPVLDLSGVKRESAKISGLLDTASVDLSNVTANANDVSAAYAANLEALEALREMAADSGVTQNFTQNNYSPRALSEAEIYRQTNNQISIAKGALSESAKRR